MRRRLLWVSEVAGSTARAARVPFSSSALLFPPHASGLPRDEVRPVNISEVFQPLSLEERQLQWNSLTLREKIANLVGYFFNDKTFVGIDFSGNRYYEFPSLGSRTVEPALKHTNHSDIPLSIPVAWQLWMQDKTIKHPPHPRMLDLLERWQAQQLQHVQRNVERGEEMKARQDGKKPATDRVAEDAEYERWLASGQR
eukprot:RCo002918